MKLIIINGPCGIGKSTLAKNLNDQMPLSFLLDTDAQSRFIGHYREYREERWEMRQEIAKVILETCFKLGRTVIVDQMSFKPETMDEYRKIAEEHNADIHEFIIWAPKELVMKRATERGFRPGLLTPEKCELFWENINDMKDKRPEATVIDATQLDESSLLNRVNELIK